MGGQMEPEALADMLVACYKSDGRVVIFVTELMRYNNNNSREPENYSELLCRFNAQVEKRCDEAAYRVLWRLK